MPKQASSGSRRNAGRPAHDNLLQILHIEAIARNSGASINAICEKLGLLEFTVSKHGVVAKRVPAKTIKRRFYAERRDFLERHPLPPGFHSRHPRSYGPYVDHQIDQLAAMLG